MYKAVIVDDERKICSLILELGDWKRFQIEIAQICSDGGEALEAICRIRPDIVLTDVRMPVYDGLELIRLVSEKGLHPAFIIISGYKYFEYAYSAFKYGVIDYLLKPIDQTQLNEVLEKTCRILEQQERYAAAENELKRLSHHIELNNRRKMFEDLFDRGETFPGTPEELLSVYQKSFPYDCFRVFLLKMNRDLESVDNYPLAEKLQDAVKKIFPGVSEERPDPAVKVCMETVHAGMAVILNFPEEETGRIRGLLQTLLLDLLDVAELFGNSWLSFGLGPTVTGLKDLPQSARAAEKMESAKLVLGTNRILDAEEAHFSRLTVEQVFTEADRRNLKNAIETLNTGALEEWMTKMQQRVDKRPPLAPDVAFGLRDAAYEEFAVCARAFHFKEEDFRKFEEGWQKETGAATGIPELFHCMSKKITDQMELWRIDRESEEKLPIRLAKAYIEEHYGETVTLEQVAEEVGLSAAYFSTQFRRVEGFTFSEYLISVRMEAAKELLSSTNMTNYEIASRIGYADEKYFAKVFKKEVGIRPAEYRKLYYRRQR